ncbi:MAG: L-threonylcarbamoyladenylate synthase [Patescibacteria group bacterium]|nr:L-threonylcarbamoyladenylate synthase [Patescibacteria group bacterium]
MQIIKVNIKNPDPQIIHKATCVLENKGVVVYPTDTAYGIGVNAFEEEAIKKLYKLKGRDFSKPTHVVVKNWKMIKKIAYTNGLARKFYDKFLPGPLTIILTKKNLIPDILTAKTKTIGIRIPKCNVTKMLSSHLKLPYTTPSANRSGEKTPYSIEEVASVLDLSQVDLVLDGGKLPNVPPSTIVDLTSNEIKIIREGTLSLEIQKFIKDEL